jgi:gluconolactonase
MRTLVFLFLIIVATPAAICAGVAVTDWRTSINPDAIVDLRSDAGAALVNAQWRVRVADIVDASATHDLMPQAGAADFDDSAWEAVSASSLETRRGNGRLSFVWYRTHVTIPEKLGDFVTSGSTAVFEIIADDYAEVVVNGKLPQVLGQAGGSLVAGWNAPNRVTLSHDDAMPGVSFTIAVLVANAPLSKPPTNKIWIRSATLKLYAPGKLAPAEPAKLEVVRCNAAMDAIVPPGAQAERLATGFGFTEGPVWHPDGYLLFSDPNNNNIHRYDPRDGGLSIYRPNSGYTGIDIARYKQPGSNGLALDPQGRLTINEHGNRRVTRLEKNGALTVLADRYEGKRLNSPNDLVYRSDGTLFFTDPPFGLPRMYDDPAKELPFSGVFRRSPAGELKLVSTDLKGPNGIALSPDETFLYVANWDEQRKVVVRYDVNGDGTLSNGTVFADLTLERGDEALDGLKVDRDGNVFVSGPGGVWVFAPSGARLGLLKLPELPANLAWGDADGRTLYLTAQAGLYRIRQLDPRRPTRGGEQEATGPAPK